jgi:ElaB/YqjD/DUF883 family membrane-anchored ribosome-binding protein
MGHRNEYEVEPIGESVVQTAVGMNDQSEELVGSIDQTMDSTAQTIQNTLRRTKKSASAAMGRVADGIETTTGYLAERGMAGVVEDVETLIRRHPFQALMLGVSVGYLISRSRQL